MRAKLIFLLACALLLSACAGAKVERPLTSYSAPRTVDVTFSVLITAETGGEDIQLSILDEVTGLAFNPRRFTMRQSAGNTYTVTIQAPVGSLIKYRYVRQGDATIPEAAANGQIISHRLFLVTGNDAANDLVSAWADQTVDLITGQISGQLTDAQSGAPLGGMTVSASGLETQSDPEGIYILGGLYQGQHTLVVSSPDGAHQTFQQAALVAEGMDTPANLQLQPTQMINLTLRLTPPEDSVPGVPVYLIGNLAQLGAGASSPDDLPRMQPQPDGSYALSLLLPTGVDIRYKYSLGDGFWNAEHLPSGGFALRQVIIPTNQTNFAIEDQVSSWAARESAAIWFEVTVPGGQAGQVYLQFRLLDWLPPLPMWSLGDGHWAYKLYSPTNFASAIEYRYCADSACSTPETSDTSRSVTGNQPGTQVIEDTVNGWQGQ